MNHPLILNIRRLCMALILVGVVLTGMVQSAAPARANDYAYYWSLTFDFDNEATGILYVAVGYDDNGSPMQPYLHESKTEVTCQRKGNASVSGGMLNLNGGYLYCDIDIQAALEQTFQECDALSPGCHMQIEDVEYYHNFRADATVLLSNGSEAPIFYHPDASYSITPGISTMQITANLRPHGVIPSSPVGAPPLNVWHQYRAFYACDPLCDMRYDVDAAVEIVPTPQERVPVFTPRTTIYIGHNPVLGLTAPAGTRIAHLFIDPPNHGND